MRMLYILILLLINFPGFGQNRKEAPIKVIERVFDDYVKYAESTDSQEDKDALVTSIRAIESAFKKSDLPVLINVWMYYDPTDFSVREIIEPIFFKKPEDAVKAVDRRIKYKKKWERPDTAPYKELFDLKRRLENPVERISRVAAFDDNLAPAAYDYDTSLKGGYIISYSTDDSFQYLHLKKGQKIITELSSTSIGMLHKNLGYVGADFLHYFVLVHSFGGGNPHTIELIQKTTGKNMLKDGAAWIDADVKQEFLLYSEKELPKKNDQMILYQVQTGKKQLFQFPDEIFDEPEVLNRIQISQLTDKLLVIHYDTKNGSKTKIYNRMIRKMVPKQKYTTAKAEGHQVNACL
jgi:hypothetical protein